MCEGTGLSYAKLFTVNEWCFSCVLGVVYRLAIWRVGWNLMVGWVHCEYVTIIFCVRVIYSQPSVKGQQPLKLVSKYIAIS